MENFDSVIFDLDGTLWDTCEACAVAWNNVLTRNEIEFRKITAEDVRGVTGKPHEECIKSVFSSLSDSEIEILAEETKDEDTKTIGTLGGDLYEGVAEGLGNLSKKYDLFIVSNCQAGYIENFLKLNSFGELFRDFDCWGNTGQSKYLNTRNLVKRNGLTGPVFVGDTDNDFEAANACSIPFIQVTYGFGFPIEGCMQANNFSNLLRLID